MDLENARKTGLQMWTIYDHPLEQPDKFVVRVCYALADVVISEPTSTAHDSLDDARESIIARGGSGYLDPMPGDDPSIVETWI